MENQEYGINANKLLSRERKSRLRSSENKQNEMGQELASRAGFRFQILLMYVDMVLLNFQVVHFQRSYCCQPVLQRFLFS